MVELTDEQIDTLARGVLKMYDKIVEFYKNPANEKMYREWHKERYGKYPTDEVRTK